MTQEFIPLLQAKQCGPDTLTISPEHGSLWVAGKIGQDLDGKLEVEYDVASRVVRLRRTDKGTPSKTRGCMQLIRAFGLRSRRYTCSGIAILISESAAAATLHMAQLVSALDVVARRYYD